MPGKLFVVATPIGNLEDLSPRALKTLREVDIVLAEDTRSFKILANYWSIATKAISYHDKNERARTEDVLALLREDKNVALTSERGTPTISDPGYRLLSAARHHGIDVSPLPGPCAAIAALSVCGFEIERFEFLGFLPIKAGKRKSVLGSSLKAEKAIIFYESPYRLIKCLEQLAELAPERDLCVARELTKVYEEIVWGKPMELLDVFKGRSAIKGEFVIIIRRE